MIRNRTHSRSLLPLLLALAVAAGAARAAEDDPGEVRPNPKLPRFASLRADEVNLRTGPGKRYPVDWVLVRRAMPVEITAEFDTWRKIRDVEGTEGWVHQSMLTGRRTVVVDGGLTPLRREAAADSPAIARVEPRVIGQLLACNKTWCRVEIAGLRGWMPRARLFGVYPDEKVE